jgi:hypothetical protein
MSRYTKKAFIESVEFCNNSLFAPFLAPTPNDNTQFESLGISCPDTDESVAQEAIPAPWVIVAMQGRAA